MSTGLLKQCVLGSVQSLELQSASIDIDANASSLNVTSTSSRLVDRLGAHERAPWRRSLRVALAPLSGLLSVPAVLLLLLCFLYL